MLTAASPQRRALLVQELERRWPGCGAHTKRNQITKRDDVVWNDLLAPQVQADIRSYVAGWETGMDAALRLVADAAPFSDAPTSAPGKRPGDHRIPISSRQRQEVARAHLESLFVDGKATES
jgi:hypothetical protein